MTDAPKRRESQELTIVIPREHLPPPSGKMLATLDLDPEHPETVDLLARAEDVEDDDSEEWRTSPTLVPCPGGCTTCNCCSGRGMVSSDAAAAWRIQQADAKTATEDE